MTTFELELLDAATRIAKRDIDGALKTMDRIQASHRRFLSRMKRLRDGQKLRLSK